jgi:NRPS condensation-like uncharacterized protein
METPTIPVRFAAAQGDLGAAQLSGLARLVLGCRLVFDRRLDPALLRRATRLMLDREPVLGCMAMREKLTSGEWIRCPDLDSVDVFSVLETDDAEADGLAFYAEDLPPTAPRLTVRLFRTPDHDELVVKFDHMAGDGSCAKQVPYMLAEVYSRLSEDPSYVPAPNLAPRPGYRDIWDAMSPEQREAADKGSAVFAAAKWKMGLRTGDGEGMFERRLVLPPRRLRDVREYGRTKGATLNDMILAAMFRSIAGMYPPNGAPFSVSVTTDARRIVDSDLFDRPCNLSTAAFVEVPSEGCDTFETTLDAVVAAVRPQKARYWNIKESRSAGPNFRFIRGMMGFFMWMMRGMKTSQPYSANIGVLDETKLAFREAAPVSAYVLGSTMRTSSFGFTTSTYRDTLTIWVGADQRFLDPALAEAALSGMDTEFAAVERDGSRVAESSAS